VLHGIRHDGVVLKGMPAVREAYRAIGLGWLLAPTRLPGLNALSEFLYRWFARNRGALGRSKQGISSAVCRKLRPNSAILGDARRANRTSHLRRGGCQVAGRVGLPCSRQAIARDRNMLLNS
jgi:hypothetical protein